MKILKLRGGRELIITDREAEGVIQNLLNKNGTVISRRGSYFSAQSIESVEQPKGLPVGATAHVLASGSLVFIDSDNIVHVYDKNIDPFSQHDREVSPEFYVNREVQEYYSKKSKDEVLEGAVEVDKYLEERVTKKLNA